MTKDIIVTISGLHDSDGESTDPVSVMAPGQYYFKGGKHYVVFDEVMEGLKNPLKSTLKIADHKLEFIRIGEASARMVFEKDQEYLMMYQTPMGALPITICTEDFQADIGEEQINVHISYLLKADEEVVSESTISVNVCQKDLKEI